MNRMLMILCSLGLVVSLGACRTGAPEREAEPEQPTVEQPAEEVGQAARVEIATHDRYGEYLVDGEGMSLYLFEADEGAEGSTCFDDCAAAWPPLLAVGEVWAGEGVDASLLSTIERPDGTWQVTYNGWPLYYFAPDQKPGDTMGQDVEGFGAEWYLVSPEGEKIDVEPPGADELEEGAEEVEESVEEGAEELEEGVEEGAEEIEEGVEEF